MTDNDIGLKDIRVEDKEHGMDDNHNDGFAAPSQPYVDTNGLENKDTMFFRDGRRRIDFIITYEDLPNSEDDLQFKLLQKLKFEEELQNHGIELEVEPKTNSVNQTTNFIKLHVTWDGLVRGAELIKLQKRLKFEMRSDLEDFGADCAMCPCFLPNEVITGPDDDFFSAIFTKKDMNLFDIQNEESFFTNAERSLIAHEFLQRAKYPENDKDDTLKHGIAGLVNRGIYKSYFPLHELPPAKIKKNLQFFDGPDVDRRRLVETWARWGKMFHYQPLDVIRRYFGEKIGIYFAWLGFYTGMLVPAAFVGLAVFIYGILTFNSHQPVKDICDTNGVGDIVLCPKCDERCTFTRLHRSCIYSKITQIFDNYATVAFAVFMAIWATFFLEFWKRKECLLQYDWDVAGFEEDEKMRPEYEFKLKPKKKKNKNIRINPITAEAEPHMPVWSKTTRKCFSFSVILFMIALVLAAIFGVIVYRMIIVGVFYAVHHEKIQEFAGIITSITGAIINLIAITLLNMIYQKLAYKLTEMESPRTQTKFDDSFTFKMFFFQFVNYYGSIFYIAFFKGKFSGRPGDVSTYFLKKYRQDECDPAGCIVDLFIQLAIIMTGKQILNNFKEIAIPWLAKFCKSRTAKDETEENKYMRWEQDNDLPPAPDTIFDEYLEMVIQYGFITIFVAAFPLAPLMALLNNIVEIRLDAIKFVNIWKRPVATKAQDIGAWYSILKFLTFIAVLSNAFIIAWTSEFVPKLVYEFSDLVTSNKTLDGYVEHKLSFFNVSDYDSVNKNTGPNENNWKIDEEEGKANLTFCRFAGYYAYNSNETEYKNRYEHTKFYWRVLLARVSVVIIFEHLVFLITWIVGLLIPDVPARVQQLETYQKQLVRHLLYQQMDADKVNERSLSDGLRKRNSSRYSNNAYGGDDIYPY
ncbi:DgyrCDS14278 [Dimorphilus gyrociliatus]|uniref:Anoctamin n=1 Tax=Dimorphilus gyrociliatus TaxID=2664684 RepID=A0A7I8WDB4_9ANNE|nr:DgyrCDS14278 [Dimorphilus gyrociliatus]